MRFRKRGKLQCRVPEVIFDMSEMIDICEEELDRQGIITGRRCYQQQNKKTGEVEFVFQDETLPVEGQKQQSRLLRSRLIQDRRTHRATLTALKKQMASSWFDQLSGPDRSNLQQLRSHTVVTLKLLDCLIAGMRH